MIRAGQISAVAVLGVACTAIVFTPSPRHSSARQGVGAYGVPGMGANLPVHFVENAGQTDARVRFHAQGAGFAFFFLTAREAVFRFAPQYAGGTTRLNTRLRTMTVPPERSCGCGMSTGTRTSPWPATTARQGRSTTCLETIRQAGAGACPSTGGWSTATSGPGST